VFTLNFDLAFLFFTQIYFSKTLFCCFISFIYTSAPTFFLLLYCDNFLQLSCCCFIIPRERISIQHKHAHTHYKERKKVICAKSFSFNSLSQIFQLHFLHKALFTLWTFKDESFCYCFDNGFVKVVQPQYLFLFMYSMICIVQYNYVTLQPH